MSRLRIRVDLALCQGHSVCMEEAPEVFRVVDRGTHYPQVQVLNEYPPQDQWDRAREAARYCPNRVITIETVDD